MKIIKNLTFAAIAATLLFQSSITRAGQHGPLRVTFSKCFEEDRRSPFGGRYVGTVAGDLGVGDVVFEFESVLPGAVIWQFTGYYIISTPDATLTVFAAGIDNLRSGGGHDVLHGEVVAGDYSGA